MPSDLPGALVSGLLPLISALAIYLLGLSIFRELKR